MILWTLYAVFMVFVSFLLSASLVNELDLDHFGRCAGSLRSKNNSSKESQVGIMQSSLYERNISSACEALQPGV
jgi:K+-transporting ATPase A subunit